MSLKTCIYNYLTFFKIVPKYDFFKQTFVESTFNKIFVIFEIMVLVGFSIYGDVVKCTMAGQYVIFLSIEVIADVIMLGVAVLYLILSNFCFKEEWNRLIYIFFNRNGLELSEDLGNKLKNISTLSFCVGYFVYIVLFIFEMISYTNTFGFYFCAPYIVEQFVNHYGYLVTLFLFNVLLTTGFSFAELERRLRYCSTTQGLYKIKADFGKLLKNTQDINKVFGLSFLLFNAFALATFIACFTFATMSAVNEELNEWMIYTTIIIIGLLSMVSTIN